MPILFGTISAIMRDNGKRKVTIKLDSDRKHDDFEIFTQTFQIESDSLNLDDSVEVRITHIGSRTKQ